MEGKYNVIAIISVVGLIVVLLAFVLVNRPIVNVNPTTTNQISVSGMAELTVEPDEAVAYVTILTDATEAKDAQDKNSQISSDVKDALLKLGINKSDIETSNYYLYKKTEWDNDKQKSVDVGYELTHTMKVTTTDTANVGKLIDTAIAAGANGVDRVTFDLTKAKEKDVRDQALAKATVAAKDKATSIVSNLNVKLGKLVSIQESNFYYTPYEYAPMNAGVYAKDAAVQSNYISPQKVNVQSTISLVYEIQ